MGQLFANNIETTIVGTVLSGDLTFVVADATGMPVPALVGDYWWGTISDAANTVWEVVKVTSVSGTTIGGLRGQDDTTALGWADGSKFQLRGNAGMFRDILNASSTFLDCGNAASTYAPSEHIDCGGA